MHPFDQIPIVQSINGGVFIKKITLIMNNNYTYSSVVFLNNCMVGLKDYRTAVLQHFVEKADKKICRNIIQKLLE